MSPLASIAFAFLLSGSALLLVLFRVSPLTAPEFALPLLFLCVLVATSALPALLLVTLKALLLPRLHPGKVPNPLLSRAFVSASLRQGIFFGIATCFLLFLFLLRILNWWIALLVYAVFVLIEMAVRS